MGSFSQFVYICISMQEIPFCTLHYRIVKMIKIFLLFLWPCFPLIEFCECISINVSAQEFCIGSFLLCQSLYIHLYFFLISYSCQFERTFLRCVKIAAADPSSDASNFILYLTMRANKTTNHLNERTGCILMKLSDITVTVHCPYLERPRIPQQ